MTDRRNAPEWLLTLAERAWTQPGLSVVELGRAGDASEHAPDHWTLRMRRQEEWGDTGTGRNWLQLDVELDQAEIDSDTTLDYAYPSMDPLTLSDVEDWIDSACNSITDPILAIDMVNREGVKNKVPEDFIRSLDLNLRAPLEASVRNIRDLHSRGYTVQREMPVDNVPSEIRMANSTGDTGILSMILWVRYTAKAWNWHYNEKGHPESRWEGKELTKEYRWSGVPRASSTSSILNRTHELDILSRPPLALRLPRWSPRSWTPMILLRGTPRTSG